MYSARGTKASTPIYTHYVPANIKLTANSRATIAGNRSFRNRPVPRRCHARKASARSNAASSGKGVFLSIACRWSWAAWELSSDEYVKCRKQRVIFQKLRPLVLTNKARKAISRPPRFRSKVRVAPRTTPNDRLIQKPRYMSSSREPGRVFVAIFVTTNSRCEREKES